MKFKDWEAQKGTAMIVIIWLLAPKMLVAPAISVFRIFVNFIFSQPVSTIIHLKNPQLTQKSQLRKLASQLPQNKKIFQGYSGSDGL